MEPTIQRYYKIFIEGIIEDAKRDDGIIDMTEWLDHVVLDVNLITSKVESIGQWGFNTWGRFQGFGKDSSEKCCMGSQSTMDICLTRISHSYHVEDSRCMRSHG